MPVDAELLGSAWTWRVDFPYRVLSESCGAAMAVDVEGIRLRVSQVLESSLDGVHGAAQCLQGGDDSAVCPQWAWSSWWRTHTGWSVLPLRLQSLCWLPFSPFSALMRVAGRDHLALCSHLEHTLVMRPRRAQPVAPQGHQICYKTILYECFTLFKIRFWCYNMHQPV